MECAAAMRERKAKGHRSAVDLLQTTLVYYTGFAFAQEKGGTWLILLFWMKYEPVLSLEYRRGQLHCFSK